MVTGDDEGSAINGTAKLLEWAAARGERFSAALVGEPTSAEALGDQVKVGRRGSFSATLTVDGKQGHAAYPEKADNPVRGLTQLLNALLAEPLDQGSAQFGPSSLEVIGVEAGGEAWNLIPAAATARFNSRYNDTWTRTSLRGEIERRLAGAATAPTFGACVPVKWRLDEEPNGAEVFLTRDEKLIGTISAAIEAVTSRRPTLSTAGGTSDARFIKNYCPVVEFGPVGVSMHQIDEHVPIDQIEQAARIYETFIDRYFET
jgi:succinyl-diaminopimelate desuccinylase